MYLSSRIESEVVEHRKSAIQALTCLGRAAKAPKREARAGEHVDGASLQEFRLYSLHVLERVVVDCQCPSGIGMTQDVTYRGSSQKQTAPGALIIRVPMDELVCDRERARQNGQCLLGTSQADRLIFSENPCLPGERQHEIHRLWETQSRRRFQEPHRFSSSVERAIEISLIAERQRDDVETIRAKQRSVERLGEVASAPAMVDGLIEPFEVDVLARHVPWVFSTAFASARSLSCASNLFSHSADRSVKARTASPSPRCHANNARWAAISAARNIAIRFVGCDVKTESMRRFAISTISLGVIELSKIWSCRQAFDLGNQHVSTGHLEAEPGVVLGVDHQPPQVFQGRIHDQLPDLRASRQLANSASMSNSLLARRLSLCESSLRERALAIRDVTDGPRDSRLRSRLP